MQSVPDYVMIGCGKIPVIESPDIASVKEAYKNTQSQLITVCERHQALVDWVGGDK